MRADFEPLTGIIRVYKDDAAFPDPYEWNITCVFHDRATVEVVGATEPPTPEAWNALLETMGAMGVHEVFYRRYEDGIERIVRHKTGVE